MKTRNFHIYSDPGHAWCKVPRKTLVKLGIQDKITPYSYQRGDSVYLEEDSDLDTFMTAMESKGIQVKFIEHNANKYSKIRSYSCYVHQM
jgi:hypothetical protein